jgi:hypothetical protein
MPQPRHAVFCVFARFLTSLARLVVGSRRSKDLEIIVVRNQLQVLCRQVERTLTGYAGPDLEQVADLVEVVGPSCDGRSTHSPD